MTDEPITHDENVAKLAEYGLAPRPGVDYSYDPNKRGTMPSTMTALDGNEYMIPAHHYSDNPVDAVFFYGGPFSNFVGGPWEITSAQPWALEHTAEYETVEHYFAASKAKTAGEHEHVRGQRGPLAAKRAGRRVELRDDWENVKYGIMLHALRVKFDLDYTEHRQIFRMALIGTGDRLIAEDSPTDYIWGIRDKRGDYGGTNLLGIALMDIRAELRA